MKWKKVSEHPLPEGDGKQQYILEILEDFSSCIYHEIAYCPASYKQHNVVRFCEFNPNEIESAELKETLKEQNMNKIFNWNPITKNTTFPDSSDNLVLMYHKHLKVTHVIGTARGCYQLENYSHYIELDSIPHPNDEIESGGSKPIPPEFLPTDHHIHHSLEAESELSWEEKFRWETAAKIFCIKPGTMPVDICCRQSVDEADMLISELKRGRE